MNSNYQVQSAVLFIVFNRIETAAQVFEKIKSARPSRLYIAADGPRAGKEGEVEMCERVRAIAKEVEWPCEVKTLFRESNLGCKEAVSSAITWFFENEEEGIILEDDCLPADGFFKYCDIMLARYRHDTRITHVGGANLQFGKKWGNASYYFSNLTHVWGWAGWRRVWQTYDKELTKYKTDAVKYELGKVFTDPFVVDTWVYVFNKLKNGMIDTWDYQLTFTNFFNNGLSIIPNKNLISNIGFGTSSTHTADANSPYANIPLEEIEEIVHPIYILPEKLADLDTLGRDFGVEAYYKKHNKLSRRFKRWIRGQKG